MYLDLPPSPGPAPSQALRPIPWPPTAGLDPADQAQLDEHRERVEGLWHEDQAGSVELAAAFGRLGQLNLAYGFVDAAEPALANAGALEPRDPRWAYYLGYLYQQRKRPEEAALSLERTLAIEPNDVPALVRLGEVYHDLGRVDEARAFLERALMRDPDAASALFALGQVAFGEGDFAAAARHWEAVLDLQPRASLVHRKLAETYHRLGDAERSQAHLARRGDTPVRLADPRVAEVTALRRAVIALIAQGTQYMKSKQFQDAEEVFGDAVARDPESVVARLNHGAALMELRRGSEARAELEAALRLDPTNVVAHQNLGTLAWHDGRADEAVREYDAVLAVQPENAAAHFALASLFAELGACDKSAAHFSLYSESDPAGATARPTCVPRGSGAGGSP